MSRPAFTSGTEYPYGQGLGTTGFQVACVMRGGESGRISSRLVMPGCR